MNLMPEILEKLGIEVGEHFDIEYDTGIKFRGGAQRGSLAENARSRGE